jgi:hypothetical protein
VDSSPGSPDLDNATWHEDVVRRRGMETWQDDVAR